MPPESHVTSDSDVESIITVQETPMRKPKRRNSTGKKYFCRIGDCQESFVRLDHLDRHEYHHTGIKKHSCTYDGCDKTYSILTHLRRHLKTTHERTAPPIKDIKCDIDTCKQMFPSIFNMQRHIREVHENPKVYKCTHCNEKFTQRLKMRRHEIANHTGVYPFNCSRCSKGFYSEWQYNRHNTCKAFECLECSVKFDKWTELVKHRKDAGHGKTFYKCDHCTRVYGKPSELKKHIEAQHANDEDKVLYACKHEGCSRSYSYERNLQQHIKVAHSGISFPCTIEGCERTFKSNQNLLLHAKRDHNEKTDNIAGKSAPEKKAKKNRRRRKDAGKKSRSMLSKLAGIVVDRETDKLLRDRKDSDVQIDIQMECDNVGGAEINDDEDKNAAVESKNASLDIENDKIDDLEPLLAVSFAND